jgi:hypothetical protein
MHLYMAFTPATAHNKLFTPTLLDIVSLWRRGFLSETSTIWVNADFDATAFWALTDRSQFVQMISQPTPGFIRITKSSIRWAMSYDETTKSPLISRDISKLPGGDKTRVSVIVRHTMPNTPVTVIDGTTAKTVKLGPDGTAEVGHVTVIDWPKYVAGSLSEPTQYERVNAALHGIEFLCDDVDPQIAALLRDYMDDYRFDISPERLHEIDRLLTWIDDYGVTISKSIYENLAMRVSGSNGELSRMFTQTAADHTLSNTSGFSS